MATSRPGLACVRDKLPCRLTQRGVIGMANPIRYAGSCRRSVVFRRQPTASPERSGRFRDAIMFDLLAQRRLSWQPRQGTRPTVCQTRSAIEHFFRRSSYSQEQEALDPPPHVCTSIADKTKPLPWPFASTWQ